MKGITGSFVYIVVICLIFSGLPANSSAQEITSGETDALAEEAQDVSSLEKESEEHPLQPAGTSNPRETLRTFLTNAPHFIDAWRQDDQRALNSLAFFHALATLDLSTTPNNASWAVKSERLLLLKEILDRLELPPDSEIPGEQEVADGAITQWIIPNTQITIARIEQGLRAGEFRFSAHTVERLASFYQQVQHLPYKPGASVGVYAAYRDFIRTGQGRALVGRVRDRLRGVDTSNPRATLEGFLAGVNLAYQLTMQAEAALTATPPTITKDEGRAIERRADNHLRRAASTFDLSQVPRAVRQDVSIEATMQLKEIFDRMLLPSLDSVPDALIVEAARETGGSGFFHSDGPLRWRYPDTEIEIVEILEGDRQGEFLFSAESVDRMSDLYRNVRDLPYRDDDPDGLIAKQYLYPGISPNFYTRYISTPGHLVPHAHVLSGWIEDHLPSSLKAMYLGQTIWQWGVLVGGLVLVLLFLILLFLRFQRRAATLSTARGLWRWVVFALMAMATIFLLYYGLDGQANLTGTVLSVLQTIMAAAFWVLLAIAFFFLGRAIAETIIASPKIDPEGVQASYIRALLGVIGFVSAALILITGLSRVGVSLVPLLTAVGVGGLALSLAARPTLENVIGSFMIFADKPYGVGQRVKVMGQDGTVEAIGIRSTKIRLLSGHLTSIPNEKMAAVEIENIDRRPYIKRVLDVTITYDMPPEKINRAVEILRDILAVPEAPDQEPADSTEDLEETAGTEEFVETTETEDEAESHPNEPINQPDFPPRVYFNDLNADSLNILVIYWYHPPDYWAYLEHAHWVNIQIMERFNAEGIDFAFPTRTLHLAGDDKRPLTVGQKWVSKEETFSPSAILAQAAALGAQAVHQTSQTPVSDSVRPKPPSQPKADEEQADAPIEEELLFSLDDEGEADEAEDDGDVNR